MLRQTGRTNDRPRNGSPRVTSQRQDTARRTPGLANIRISGQTVRSRLRESEFRARRPVVGPILKQRHRTTRLARDRARHRWRLHTWQHILFSDESRFLLRFSDERYRIFFIIDTSRVLVNTYSGNLFHITTCTLSWEHSNCYTYA